MQVSWILSTDLQVLTSGRNIFTSDNRFTITNDEAILPHASIDGPGSSVEDKTESWSLHITNVRSEDSGQYECQINTEPKLKSNVTLLVRGKYFDYIFVVHEIEIKKLPAI